MPDSSNSLSPSDASRTFSDIIDEVGDLPDPTPSEELEWAINEFIFSGEDDVQFQDAWITTRPVRNVEIEETVLREGSKMHRLECQITGTEFFVSKGALIPVVVFQTTGENDAVEPWTKRVNPRLVAAGREAVMEALVASYLRNKLVDAGAELMWALQQLSVLREVDVLGGGWPDFEAPEKSTAYAADEEGPVPGLNEAP
ncbi:MAG: hypothetical protein ABEL51_06780 [Salinibacter sp.]